jgi:ArsR family transcriptional regulator
MMLSASVLSRRKEGLKIYYAINHPEILEVMDIVTHMVTQDISRRHKLLNAR